MKELTNAAVRAAIDDCLSGVQDMPSVRADVMNQLRGEMKVKKKFSVGIVFALLLTVLMAGAALAAGLGLFGQIGGREHSDGRLPGLDRVSADVNLSIVTEEGVTVTIGQAYYDGERVFISYTVAGPFDQLEMGEGKPEGLGECDWELPGEIYGQYFFSESASHAPMAAHLDGSAPRWATQRYVNVHDGLRSGGTELEIIGGETYLTEDGTLVGWKECIVPEEAAAKELVVSIGTFTSVTTFYQDESGLYVYSGDRDPAVWHEFTVKMDPDGGAALVGNAEGDGWMAKAHLTVSAIDVKGEIFVKCPQSWVEIQRTWENPNGVDYIREWKLYVGGVVVEGHNLDGSIDPRVDGQLTYTICYKLDALVEDMLLVPIYRDGPHMDEAITLRIAE